MPGTNYEDGTKSVLRSVGAVVLGAVVLIALVGVLVGVLLSPGCGVLYRADGTPVPAVEFGEGAPGELGQFLHTAADFLPPPFNYLAGGAVTLLVGGGGAAIARRRAEQAKRDADAAWDESNRAAELAAARRDAAFDEGSQRAAPIASVSPAPVVVGLPDSRPSPLVAPGVAQPPASP